MLCNNLLLLAPPRAELTPIRARGAGWGHHGCMVTTRQVAPLTTCLAHSEEISGVMEAEGDMDNDAWLKEEGIEGHVESELDTAPQHLIIEDNFLAEARELREIFDERFSNPYELHGHRFMWDYWHVPYQYTNIRTSAEDYFPKPLYDKLHTALLDWGRENLGCSGMTPMWLSYYVDGCEQALHCDNPHGPWAFVLSLTEWDEREFTGGETVLLRPEVLDFWGSVDVGQRQEFGELMEVVPALFNRLVVFDPRIPHGVRRVQGTQDPRGARLVVHGWFTEPVPEYSGDLSEDVCQGPLNECMEGLVPALNELPEMNGTLVMRINVEPSGAVGGFEVLTNTLMVKGAEDPDDTRADAVMAAASALMDTCFPETEKGGDITLPLIFC